MSTPVPIPRRKVTVRIDGAERSAAEGSTILDVCRDAGVEVPTICWDPTITPVNACRVCVVELEGSRTLVPACSRQVTEGMEIRTGGDRVRASRRMVLELLASSVDLSRAEPDILRWLEEYGTDPERHGADRARVSEPVRRHDELYVRDYDRCVLCYKCVDACGTEAQYTFAIAVAGRGFDARISTEYDVELPESACVYCGNCIGVCPTGALIFTREFDLREAGRFRSRGPGGHHDRLPLLRRRLQPGVAHPGRRDLPGHLARRSRGDLGAPLHQGPLRLRVRRRSAPRTLAGGGPGSRSGREPAGVNGARRQASSPAVAPPRRRPRRRLHRGAVRSWRGDLHRPRSDAARGIPPACGARHLARHVRPLRRGRRRRLRTQRRGGRLRRAADLRWLGARRAGRGGVAQPCARPHPPSGVRPAPGGHRGGACWPAPPRRPANSR